MFFECQNCKREPQQFLNETIITREECVTTCKMFIIIENSNFFHDFVNKSVNFKKKSKLSTVTYLCAQSYSTRYTYK